ncbi:hypothetical protein PIB30_085414 [Stylosanthes scabra]|uniref:Uncharacterized protein n=1 Tax=Stylosanthes scabra TaxID=79078 RepID=A0ABU6VRA3_9FABA|nr:hypothetical protein [Stylosanthes scabra]
MEMGAKATDGKDVERGVDKFSKLVSDGQAINIIDSSKISVETGVDNRQNCSSGSHRSYTYASRRLFTYLVPSLWMRAQGVA